MSKEINQELRKIIGKCWKGSKGVGRTPSSSKIARAIMERFVLTKKQPKEDR